MSKSKRVAKKKHFSVSMQHYVFAVHAFVSVAEEYDASKYVYSVYETRTDEVLNNVKNLKTALENADNADSEVILDNDTISKAAKPLQRMLEMAK